MNWPWHLLWWLTLIEGAGALVLLLAHQERTAAKPEALIGARLLQVVLNGFLLWFLTTYAPPWAMP